MSQGGGDEVRLVREVRMDGGEARWVRAGEGARRWVREVRLTAREKKRREKRREKKEK